MVQQTETAEETPVGISGQTATLIHVAPDDIFVPERQRKAHDANKHADLKSSIERIGLIHAPTVRPPNPDEDTTGKPWVLVAGERRLRVLKDLGWQMIPCSDKRDLPAWQQKAMELEENTKRVNLTWQEEVQAKADIHMLYLEHVPDWTAHKTAQVLGEHAGNLSRDLKLAKDLEAHPDLQIASSKKAARRDVDIREHAKGREQTLAKGKGAELAQKLLLGDARELITRVQTASIGMTFTDLPYGQDYYHRLTGRGGKTADVSQSSSSYDDTKKISFALAYAMLPEMVRVTKPTGWIVLTANSEFAEYLRHLLLRTCVVHYSYGGVRYDEFGLQVVSKGPCKGADGHLKCVYQSPEDPHWIWYKPGSQSISQAPEYHADSKYETIVVYNRGEAKLLRPYCSNVITADPLHSSQRIHSMQKPIELAEEVLSRCSASGETVLDTTFGSGIFLAAAAKMSRDILGFEANPVSYTNALALVSGYYGA